MVLSERRPYKVAATSEANEFPGWGELRPRQFTNKRTGLVSTENWRYSSCYSLRDPYQMLGNPEPALTQAFISYAHDATTARSRNLHACLKPVARAFKLDVWADKRLLPGQYWNDKIAEAIEASDIHILLDEHRIFQFGLYLFDQELPAIVARCRNGSLTVPVLIERCFWHAFVNQLQATPMNEKGRLVAVKEWKPPRTGYSIACDQIAKAIEDHFHLAPATPFDWGKP